MSVSPGRVFFWSQSRKFRSKNSLLIWASSGLAGVMELAWWAKRVAPGWRQVIPWSARAALSSTTDLVTLTSGAGLQSQCWQGWVLLRPLSLAQGWCLLTMPSHGLPSCLWLCPNLRCQLKKKNKTKKLNLKLENNALFGGLAKNLNLAASLFSSFEGCTWRGKGRAKIHRS